MRIAQVAPLYESVPPDAYGGTERAVWWLTEELVARGHDVTLFASGDSRSSARLVSPVERSLRRSGTRDPLAPHIVMLEHVFQRSADFDVIHLHTDYLHFPLARRAGVPVVTTLHGRLDLADLVPLYQEFDDIPVISISDAQRRPLPWINWQATVYHGLPVNHLRFHPDRGTYLAFLGRISPEKGVDRAIHIARRVGLPLRIAAKVDPVDHSYFTDVIRPMLKEPGIEYLGEITERHKDRFLGEAMGLLFPIDWPEPFGIVMIEALACGTPVVAMRAGSVPEILADGATGFVVNSVEEAVRATSSLPTLDRRRCRQVFEARFTVDRMVDAYLSVYRRLIEAGRAPRDVDAEAVALSKGGYHVRTAQLVARNP